MYLASCKRFVRALRPHRLAAAALLVTVALTSACGGEGTPRIAPTITVEPDPLSTPVGQIATFAVTATGTAPLQYQWSANGAAIPGATSASYSTAALAASDNGESFTVVITNAEGSVTSVAATLTVLPRAPAAGDWRFQGIDLPAGTFGFGIDLVSFQTITAPDSLGTTLEVGVQYGFDCAPPAPNDCAWNFFTFNAPSGIAWPKLVYQSDSLSNLEDDLNILSSAGTVITSLDLEPSNQVFAVSSLQLASPAGFSYASETIPLLQLQERGLELGAQGRVITAMSYDADQNIRIISYGWQSDTTTTYEIQAVSIGSTSTDVATASSSVIIGVMSDLASKGYIITAMCGDASNGLVLVGTRVKGDTLARPIAFFTTSQQGHVSNGFQSLIGTVGGTTPDGTVQFYQQ